MPIITNSNEIPNEFNSSDYKQMSNSGMKRIKKVFNLNEENGFLSSRDEILNAIFNTCLDCCKYHFGKNKDVSFINYYRRNGLDVTSNESNIFMNEALLHSLSHYINVVIYHASDFENPDVSFYCFKQLIVIINEQCNNTFSLPNEEDFIDVMERFKELKTLCVAIDVYWGMITFLILHELSHIFLDHPSSIKNKTIAEQEYEIEDLIVLE